MAEGLAAVPTLGMRLAHGREYERDSIDVFFIVATEGGDELTGVKVNGVDRLSPAEIATELERRTSAIATGSDQEFGRAKQMLTVLPPWLLRRAATFDHRYVDGYHAAQFARAVQEYCAHPH